MERDEIEHLLDTGALQMRFIVGYPRQPKWYNMWRNGRTKTWKRTPDRFSIPVRIGFRNCFRIENNHGYTLRARPTDFNARTRQ